MPFGQPMHELMDDFFDPPRRPRHIAAGGVAIAIAMMATLSACGDDDEPMFREDAGTGDSMVTPPTPPVPPPPSGDAGRDATVDGDVPPPPDASPDGDVPPPTDGAVDAARDAEPPPPVDECEAMDAHGVGDCEVAFGFAWDGTACIAINGCSCEGTQCRRLLASQAECELRYADCLFACGGEAGLTCPDDRYCDFPETNVCGFDDTQGHCKLRPTSCSRILAPVCGCNDVTYDNDCEAHRAGFDWSRRTDCESPPPPPPPPTLCDADDARGEGFCDGFFGYAWNGRSCVGISGCSCVGADCEGLLFDERECIDAHSSCVEGGDCRTTGCPEGMECQLCFVDFACIPRGAVC